MLSYYIRRYSLQRVPELRFQRGEAFVEFWDDAVPVLAQGVELDGEAADAVSGHGVRFAVLPPACPAAEDPGDLRGDS